MSESLRPRNYAGLTGTPPGHIGWVKGFNLPQSVCVCVCECTRTRVCVYVYEGDSERQDGVSYKSSQKEKQK